MEPQGSMEYSLKATGLDFRNDQDNRILVFGEESLRNETTQLVSRNETTQLCTAVDRLQPPTTTCNRLQPPTTACNRLKPPTTAYSRLQPPTTAYNRLQPPTTACNRLQPPAPPAPPAPPLQQNRLFLQVFPTKILIKPKGQMDARSISPVNPRISPKHDNSR
ncbi:hypothetical protein TNCV_4950371 [Trichonephila clavipes]|nr:hypothetical protein TNCV_4950371 [Trichonephila clavipes]